MKTSPITDAPHLVLRDDSHLFLINDANRCHEQHLGQEIISPSTSDAWARHILEFDQVSRDFGGFFHFLSAPDKQSVYWDRLSDQPDHRNILEIFKRIPSVSVVDPLEGLRSLARCDAPPPYPEVDTHWCSEGALVAMSEIARRCGHGVPIESLRGEFTDYRISGDLGIKLMPNESSEARNLKVESWKRFLVYDNGIPDNGRVRLFVNNQASRGESVLVCGDSFSYRFVELLSQFYRTVMHFHGAYHDRRLLLLLRPAIIVFEQTERFFIRPPRFSMDVPIDRFIEEKLAAGIDLLTPVSTHRLFKPSTVLDVSQMLFVDFAERVLSRWGLTEDTAGPKGSSSWSRNMFAELARGCSAKAQRS